MAYLNVNIPPIYCKLRKEYLYDLKEHHGKVKNVLSSLPHQFQAGQSYLISCYQMVRVIGVCLSQRFSKNRMTEPMCQICKSTNWNCGTVLVTGLVLLALIGWMV